MTSSSYCLLLATAMLALACAALPAGAQAPAVDADFDDEVVPAPAAPVAEPSCFGDKIRVSALISSSGRVKVGLVVPSTRESYLVSPGDRAGEVEVVDADYERETVTLRLGEEVCTLNLAGDTNAVAQAPVYPAAGSDGIYRGEAIERFLRDNPHAMQEGMVKFPLPVMPAAQGKGEGIEKFLRENPELAAQADRPVVGKGEGIESFLRQHPEIKVYEETEITGFGPGIEEQLRLNPQFMTNQTPGIPPEMIKP